MKAYSEQTGTEYPSWDALVAAETNGWVVISTCDKPKTYPYAKGPFKTKQEAQREAAKLRSKYAKNVDIKYEGYPIHVYVRHLWSV